MTPPREPAPPRLPPFFGREQHASLAIVGGGLLLAVLWCLIVAAAHIQPFALDAALRDTAWQTPARIQPWVCLLLIIVTAAGVWRSEAAPAQSPVGRFLAGRGFYFFLIAAVMLCCRWQTLAGYEMNVDESQSIVAARMLLVDSHFWRSVDMGTHGPVVAGVQALLPRFGIAIDYASSRLLGLCLLTFTLFALFSLLRRAATERVARLLLLPALFVFATLRANDPQAISDYVAYNGEHPILFLLTFAAALAVSALIPARGRTDTLSARDTHVRLFCAGLFAGAVPWAKLQGVPLCAALLLTVAVACFHAGNGVSPREGRARLISLGVGAALPSLLVLLWLQSWGGVPLMIVSYFEWNLAYASRIKTVAPFADSLRLGTFMTARLLFSSSYHRAFCVAGAAGWVGAVAAFCRTRRFPPPSGLFLAAVCLLAVAYYSVIRPGNYFAHYSLLLFLPALFLTLLAWGTLLDPAPGSAPPSPLLKPALLRGVFLAATVVGPLLWWQVSPGNRGESAPIQGQFRYIMRQGDILWLLRLVTDPGERVALWGWNPQIYNLTDTLPASRVSVSSREAWRGLPLQNYFYRLWLADFDRSAPAVFVDEVRPASALLDNYRFLAQSDATLPRGSVAQFAHESYPEFDSRIRGRYRLFYTDRDGYRVYVRNDRLADAVARVKRAQAR